MLGDKVGEVMDKRHDHLDEKIVIHTRDENAKWRKRRSYLKHGDLEAKKLTALVLQAQHLSKDIQPLTDHGAHWLHSLPLSHLRTKTKIYYNIYRAKRDSEKGNRKEASLLDGVEPFDAREDHVGRFGLDAIVELLRGGGDHLEKRRKRQIHQS